jgi:signal transduction histidine kinase/ActR/RegA family two-component response regulator
MPRTERAYPVSPLETTPPLGLSELLRALQAVRDGDFSVRLPGDWTGLEGKIADTFNQIVTANARMAGELARVATVVGKTRALEQLNTELEVRVAERTAELEATTKALQDADRRKDEFLAMLAHELRNPLAPIRTAVQLLRLKELGEPQRVRARDVIERQVEYLVCLIDDLLDVSRITRGMITLRREPVLLGAIVARAVETTRPAIDARRQEFTIELPDELITIEGDKTRLVQVIGNILHNAAKFTDAGGRIVLRVSRDTRHAIISIKDTGVGIPPEAMSKVFELFTRVHAQSESGQGGLGIGLALVRRLAEMHDGTVTAHSDGPGCGSEFIVRLPLLKTQTARVLDQPAEPPQIPDVEPRRILIADDNHDAAESLATLLQLRGHEVRTAHDGEEALAAAKVFKPDVVLLDLGMPKMDGYEAARRIRRLAWGRRARLVALTGWGQQQDRQRTREAGFDAHLVKPVSDVDLFRALTAGKTEPKPDAAAAG